MADPSPQLEGLGVAGTLLGTLITAGSQLQSNSAAQQVYRNNQAIALMAARRAVARGNVEAQQTEMKASQAIGRQQSAYGASGVATNAGTPVDVASQTRLVADVDAQAIRNNAASEAWGYSTEAQNIATQAKYAQRESEFGAAGTLVGGVTKTLPSLASFAGLL